MRAVNLIPVEERRGAGAPTRSGGAVYVVLAALAVAVVLLSGWALAGRSVTERQADLERVRAEASSAETQASSLAPYQRFSELRRRRVTEIRQLTASRFDWAAVLHEVGRVVPRSVKLSSIDGTVRPGVAVEGAAAAASGMRQNVAAPAVELAGCAPSQSDVARLLARLRAIEGVTKVALGSSEKPGEKPAGSAATCAAKDAPQFTAVAFFEGAGTTPGGPATPAAAGGPAPAPAPTGASAGTAPAADTGGAR